MDSTWTGGPPKEAVLNELAKTERLWTELEVVADRDATADTQRQREQFVGFGRVYRERFFEIDVTAGFQAQPAQRKVRLGRRGDVNGVHAAGTEQVSRVGEDVWHAEAIRELTGHQLVRVAGRHQLAARKIPKLVRVLVRDHPATDNRYPGLQ